MLEVGHDGRATTKHTPPAKGTPKSRDWPNTARSSDWRPTSRKFVDFHQADATRSLEAGYLCRVTTRLERDDHRSIATNRERERADFCRSLSQRRLCTQWRVPVIVFAKEGFAFVDLQKRV